MSTNAAVRSAWQTNVFDNISGVNSYNYAIDPDSGIDLDKAYSSGTINFFQYIVKSHEMPALIGGRNRVEYTVTITRIIQDDTDGTNFNTLIDDFRDINDNVNDNLGNDWGSTVDLTTEFPTSDDINPEITAWDGKSCWTATVQYRAEKLVDN